VAPQNEYRNSLLANQRSQHLTGTFGRVELLPDTYLRRPVPAIELMGVGMRVA
jgi:hypothetical protein